MTSARVAGFKEATFNGDATFDMATFTRVAFEGATFNGDAQFQKVAFTNDAEFKGAIFNGLAFFGESLNRVSLDGARVASSNPDINKWWQPGGAWNRTERAVECCDESPRIIPKGEMTLTRNPPLEQAALGQTYDQLP